MTDIFVPAAEPPTGTLVARWSLRPEPSSAQLARRLVSQELDGVTDQAQRRASLIVSELVTNALRHARGGLDLELTGLTDGWLILVADNSAAPPVLRPERLLSESGRGLVIVSRVSDAIGWARTTTGKLVWARFH